MRAREGGRGETVRERGGGGREREQRFVLVLLFKITN